MLLIISTGITFNRTIEELKYGKTDGQAAAIFSFNRTIEELKFLQGNCSGCKKGSFNRTIEELKCFGNEACWI